MKMTRKLVIAVALLLVSATLLGTSSFAWFAQNRTVTAKGMQVVAKSDNVFLLISKDNSTATTIQTENAISAALTVENTDAKVYPSAPAGETTYVYTLTTDETKQESKTYYAFNSNSKTFAEGVPTSNPKAEGFCERAQLTNVNSTATAAVVGNWYTASGKDATSAGYLADESSIKALTGFDGYVIQKTVYLTVAKGSNGANNLKVTPTITQKGEGTDVSAVKVLVTTNDGGFAILKAGDDKIDIKGSNTDLTDSTVLTVNIYIYYDGNDNKVYTNNATNLTGADIELEFFVDAIPAA